MNGLGPINRNGRRNMQHADCNTQSTRLQQGDCAGTQVMHTVGLMDRLLKGQGLDLAIVTYNVIATSFEVGLVECVHTHTHKSTHTNTHTARAAHTHTHTHTHTHITCQ